VGAELQARTEPGRRLVLLAEELAAGLAANAADHDRDGSYPHEGVAALRDAGYLAAPVPQSLGGMGVESVHDLIVAASRLARGDASVAIGASMHLIPVVNTAHRWRAATLAGDGRRAAAYGSTLERVVREGAVMAAAVSEPNQDLTRPRTRAERTDDGWVVRGHKVFCTMSPAATELYAAVTFDDGDGERYGYARIPAEADGVRMNGDWDALGMRASGSQSVTFDDVRLPAAALRGGFPAGRLTDELMEANLVAGGLHAASSLGIAEAAHATAVAAMAPRVAERAPAPRALVLVAEAEVELAAVRAAIARAGDLIDGHLLRPGDVTEVFADVQAAKAFANEASVRVVDRALALSGGAGYMTAHPLSRAYRDVRAGAFMHPLGANRAYEFIGEVALGLAPTLG
jgi:alkylation response protein AidB-like acyl-CoA dehydrogenase